MRNRLRLPALAIVSVILATACGGGGDAQPVERRLLAGAASTPPVSGGASAPAASGSGSARPGDRRRHARSRCGPAPRPKRAPGRWSTAYNASHKNQVELTVVPTDDYQAKVGAAAGSNGLPDLFSADVVFMPNWTSQGLFQDITEQDRRPAVRGQDRPGAHRRRRPGRTRSTACRSSSTCRSGCTTRPSTGRPGSIPEKPPTTLDEFADPGARRRQARRRHPRHVLRRQLRRLRGLHLVADHLGRRRAGHERRRHRVAAQQRRRTRRSTRPSSRSSTTAPSGCRTPRPRPARRGPATS